MSLTSTRHRVHLTVNSLEGRIVPAGWVATGADAGGGPHVIIRTDANGDGNVDTVASSFFAFDPSFRGGVRVAVGDLNGDGYTDLVTAAGPGAVPLVRIWAIDAGGHVIGLQEEFYAFDRSFRGGCYVTTGVFSNHYGSFDSLVVAAGEGGGPHVKVFRDIDFNGYVSDHLIDQFFAFESDFRGGVRISVGTFYVGTPSGGPGVIVGAVLSAFNYLTCAAGPGGGPHVKVYNSFGEFDVDQKISNNGIAAEFFAFDANYRGGVFVNSGDRSHLTVSGGGSVDTYRISISQFSNGTLPGVTRYGVPAAFSQTKEHSFQPLAGYTGDVHLSNIRLQDNDFGSNVVTTFGTGVESRVIRWTANNSDFAGLVMANQFNAFVDSDNRPYFVGVWVVQGY